MTLNRTQLLEMTHAQIRAYFLDTPGERGDTKIIRAPQAPAATVEDLAEIYWPACRPITFHVEVSADGTVSTVVEQGNDRE